MPASVKAHYDTHLAPLYSWIHGGAEPAQARSAALLAGLAIVRDHAQNGLVTLVARKTSLS